MNNRRTPEVKAEQRQASRDKRREHARPHDDLGFFVAGETSTVYHPISSSKDWDYDVRNSVCDPGRGRENIETVIADNALYLRGLGKKHRKGQPRLQTR